MADSPLRECWDKLSRGEEHLKTFYEESQRFLDSDPYLAVREYDAKEIKYLFRLNVVQPIPQARWATIIGDCVHNARSALDYIAWRLAGSGLADRQTLFPIYDTVEKFNSSRWRLARIHKDALTEIAKLQPYTRSDPENSLLWILQELDARDKHKLLTMTAMRTAVSGIFVESPFKDLVSSISPAQILCSNGGLDHDAIIAEVILPADSANRQMKVEAKFIFDISFERGIIDPTGTFSVRNGLRHILDAVNQIIRLFEELLISNPHWIS